MVDVIVKLTGLAVLAVAVMNLAQGALMAARLIALVTRRYPHLRLDLWFPRWEDTRDVRTWLATWRGILRSGDPSMAAIRVDGRRVMMRHVQLMVSSEAWVMAVATMVPRLS
ncbi:MAG TPA: hypothetical protein VGT02_04190 [Methylomirabilota bacterium]|jgi:hypothetical protein|nr:hypothetical protein [Methylomirabilota bacterium]